MGHKEGLGLHLSLKYLGVATAGWKNDFRWIHTQFLGFSDEDSDEESGSSLCGSLWAPQHGEGPWEIHRDWNPQHRGESIEWRGPLGSDLRCPRALRKLF